MKVTLFYRFDHNDLELWELLNIFERLRGNHPSRNDFRFWGKKGNPESLTPAEKAGRAVCFLRSGQGTLNNLLDFLGFMESLVTNSIVPEESQKHLEGVLLRFREKLEMAHLLFCDQYPSEEEKMERDEPAESSDLDNSLVEEREAVHA